jgi:membrane-associated phospholipid phosphatase
VLLSAWRRRDFARIMQDGAAPPDGPMFAALLTAVTDFGDLAVLLPIAGIIPLWLAAMRHFGAALRWGIAAAFCAGGIAILKIFFYACPPLAELRSPSGHAGFSTLVYGAVTLIIAVEATGWRRMLIYAGGAAFVLVIALSRILLRAHSPLEAVFGLGIGLMALAIFAQAYLTRRPAGISLRPFVASLALLLVLLHGQQLHAEELLHAIGIYLQLATLACT